MAELTRMDLKQIAARRGFPVVSVHTPTEKVGEPLHRNSVLVRNAVTEAKKALAQHGVEGSQADELLRPLSELGADRSRMLHQLGGMSIFLQEKGYDIVELPGHDRLQVEVSERPALLPLIAPTFHNRDFAVLTLSRGGAGLYRCSRYSAELVELPGLPEDLAYVLRYDDFEKSIQPHMTDSSGSKAGMHGHGMGKDTQDSVLDRFVSAVEKEVSAWMHRHQLPLVLMGVPDVIGRYRKASAYPHLVDPQVEVDPFSIGIDYILSTGWTSVEPRVEEARKEAIDRYGTAESKSEEIYTVLSALTEGRVATLFIDPSEEIRGSYDSERGAVHRENGSEEDGAKGRTLENLVNRCVIEGLSTGTEIVVVGDELPTPSVILH